MKPAAPPSDAPGPETDRAAWRGDTPGAGLDVAAWRGDTPGAGLDVAAWRGGDTPGAGLDVAGWRGDTPGAGVDLVGRRGDTPGLAVERAGGFGFRWRCSWLRVAGRLGAGLSVLGLLGHVPLAYDGVRGGDLALLGIVLAMTALCLPCVFHLWRGPTRAGWGMTAAMTAAMLALHGSLASLAGHHHGAGPGAYSTAPALALLLLSIVAAGLERTRGDSPWRVGQVPR
ncbi:hypothetical protein ACQPZJ_16680 [Actinoplanes sp. CA-054009]